MSNPNLDRDKAYLRLSNKMYLPVDDKTKGRDIDGEFRSINQAKLRSRELMKQGHVIVTKP